MSLVACRFHSRVTREMSEKGAEETNTYDVVLLCCPWGEGGYSLNKWYKLDRYVQQQMAPAWFFSHFGLSSGIDFEHFGQK